MKPCWNFQWGGGGEANPKKNKQTLNKQWEGHGYFLEHQGRRIDAILGIRILLIEYGLYFKHNIGNKTKVFFLVSRNLPHERNLPPVR